MYSLLHSKKKNVDCIKNTYDKANKNYKLVSKSLGKIDIRILK